MSQSKSIIINSQDFSNIEKVFFKYLQENDQDPSALQTIQSIIDQCIDKPEETDLFHSWTKSVISK